MDDHNTHNLTTKQYSKMQMQLTHPRIKDQKQTQVNITWCFTPSQIQVKQRMVTAWWIAKQEKHKMGKHKGHMQRVSNMSLQQATINQRHNQPYFWHLPSQSTRETWGGTPHPITCTPHPITCTPWLNVGFLFTIKSKSQHKPTVQGIRIRKKTVKID